MLNNVFKGRSLACYYLADQHIMVHVLYVFTRFILSSFYEVNIQLTSVFHIKFDKF